LEQLLQLDRGMMTVIFSLLNESPFIDRPHLGQMFAELRRCQNLPDAVRELLTPSPASSLRSIEVKWA